MPFSSSDLVLVTGANGFLGAHVVKALLESPVRVRGTVRSANSAKGLEQAFQQAIKEKKLEIVYVPDIIADGAFDSAAKGATMVAHVASPLPNENTATNPEENLLKPAISGTVGLLKSAQRAGTVKKVVVTSSIFGVFNPLDQSRKRSTLTEADWNETTYEQAVGFANHVASLGDKADALMAMGVYASSKVVAERHAWKFHKENEKAFSLATINPVVIIGPGIFLEQATTGTNHQIFAGIEKAPLSTDGFTAFGLVDVRDVAAAHVAALLRPEADGKRFILCATQPTYYEIVEIARKTWPTRFASQDYKPKPNEKDDWSTVDGSRATKELGLKYRPLEETVKDLLGAIEKAGKL